MGVPTQLTLYQGACAVLGERILQSLTENREVRRALDDIWNRDWLSTCLANGLWHFAKRAIQWNYDPSYTPPFGYQCVFEIPSDWVRWMSVAVDPYYENPLLQCSTEGQFFYCDLQQLWVAYVSNDPGFGMNFAAWPENFTRYVEAYGAAEVCQRVTGDENKTNAVQQKREMLLNKAKSTDAMNESTTLLPAGNWRQARHGRRGNIERGNPYSLIG
jgi:hypothetical protein